MKKKLFRLLTQTAVLYLIITVFVNFVIWIQFHSSEQGANFSAGRSLLFLPCAFCLSLATAVRKSSVNAVFRWILHAALCIFGVFFFAVLPGMQGQTGADSIVALGGLLVIYLLCTGLCVILALRMRRADEEKKKYTRR